MGRGGRGLLAVVTPMGYGSVPVGHLFCLPLLLCSSAARFALAAAAVPIVASWTRDPDLSDLVVILIAALDRKSTDRKTRRRSSRPDPLDQEDLGLASYGVSLSRAALHRRHPTHTRAVCRVATTTLGAPIRHRTRCARISHPRIRTRATHDAGPRALSHSPRPNPYLRVLAARATVLARIS